MNGEIENVVQLFHIVQNERFAVTQPELTRLPQDRVFRNELCKLAVDPPAYLAQGAIASKYRLAAGSQVEKIVLL